MKALGLTIKVAKEMAQKLDQARRELNGSAVKTGLSPKVKPVVNGRCGS